MKTIFRLLCLAAILSAGNAWADPTDARQKVDYPDEVKAKFLANMRDHLESLADIAEALSQAQYARAADIADTELGMNSQGATACRPSAQGKSMHPMMDGAGQDHLMAQRMPAEMRKLGQNMHRAANEFAEVARKAEQPSGSPAAASAALGNVIKQCTICHAAFRVN